MINKTDKTRIALMFHDSVDFWFNLSCDMLLRHGKRRISAGERQKRNSMMSRRMALLNKIKKSEEREPQT